MNWSNLNVTVTGGAGFLGRFVCKKLAERGCQNIQVPRSAKYDLTTEDGTQRMYADFDPDIVIHLAAEVGGIGANREHPGRFCYANLSMGMNLIEFGRRHGLKKFVQAGTVCAYPKFAPAPFAEKDLWNGYPEETNAPYGVAKKSLFVLLDAYYQEYAAKSAVVVPVNLYGPGDNFNLQTSHVIPALIRKCVEANQRKEDRLVCWGTGCATREFLHVEDAAEGVIRAAELMDRPTPINLGTGRETPIRELVQIIAELTGFQGEILWDSSKPDGQPRRCLDTSRARELLSWESKIDLTEGLAQTINWYLEQGYKAKAA